MDIAEHLRALEGELLTNATRKNAARVASLLTDTFQEFGSSGRSYSKDDVIAALQEEAPVSISLMSFKVKLLSKEIALVTYQSQKDQFDASPKIALRSSIWIQDGGHWRMVFHQGTNVQ